jgi:hypothetical protein
MAPILTHLASSRNPLRDRFHTVCEYLSASAFTAQVPCQRPAGSGGRKDGKVEAGGMITGGSAPSALSPRMDGKVEAGGIGAGASGGGSGRER